MKEISEQRAKEILSNKGISQASVTPVKSTESGSHEPTGSDKWPVSAVFEEDNGELVIGVPSGPREL